MPTLRAELYSIPEQISQLENANPYSIALSAGDLQLTYRELNRRADRFAEYLIQIGVVSGDAVAICLERSFDWIVAALGIMRAGAAYVPLDSAWPDARLRHAMNDSGAAILVAREALLDRLGIEANGVDPSRDSEAIACARRVIHGVIQPEGLAYVIYTSGSTGTPKGVEITHANLAHLIRWHVDAFGVTQHDRASHLAGLGFDASAWEIWPNLCAGATVCLADEEVRSSPELIQQWMLRERVTIGFVPTVHATPMLTMKWPANTALRLLLTGGDKLHHGPTVKLPFEVVNNYGPTECTVVATSAVLSPGSDETPPIGRAITGASVYLLDEEGRQVPQGSCGEIYIGGTGVGRGYRNLPEATDLSFLPDPFAATPGARMYRTGDRGVRRPNGEIEFHGRLDRQTKIRGYRIELDEIGSILTQHPSIAFATAVTKTSAGGEIQLLGYFLPEKDVRVPTVKELQKHLMGSLPDYMIPAAFVQLDTLPVSPNGKLDLALLPQPAATRLPTAITEKSSASSTEEKLLTMVRGLLSNDQVSSEDSFFLAGGHSLLGMQLLVRLRETFGVDLTLRQLLEASTARRLARLVEAQLNGANSSSRNVIFWVQSKALMLANALPDDRQPVLVDIAKEEVEQLGEKPTVERIAACLVRKIQDKQPRGPYTIGGWCLGAILGYEVAFQLRAAGHDVSHLVLLNAPNPSTIATIKSPIDSCDTLSDKLMYLGYVLKRSARLGPRVSLIYAYEHLVKRLARKFKLQPVNKVEKTAHRLLEPAIYAYHPPKYDGKVLLLLASERPPHMDLVPGWQAFITGDLHIKYVNSHARDLLLKPDNTQTIADAIVTFSKPAPDCRLSPCSPGTVRKSSEVKRLLAS